MLRDYAPEAPMYRIFTMDALAERALASLSFTTLMLLIASSLALVLGAVGLYGVLSYVVSQRRREIAVRMALGAEQSAVRKMVVVQGALVAVIGVAIGIGVAFVATGLLQSLLFGVGSLDPATYAASLAVILAAAALASFLPARRAADVDPAIAMRID